MTSLAGAPAPHAPDRSAERRWDPVEGGAGGLAKQVDALAAFVRAAEPYLPSHRLETARELADRATRRLSLPLTFTVVALAGATGGGKSSLFNALAGANLSPVGVRRPTTGDVYAAVFGRPEAAADLLDWLKVQPARRFAREGAVVDDGDGLSGLVLLDLPDFDSVERGHAAEVERLLRMVDVVVWVVDPQKYADNALHARYLRGLADRQDAMLVLVNQVDTLPEGAVPRVVDSVRDLLRADGLDEVEVITTSTVTGEGIADVREVLARTVARRSTAARTAEAEIDAIARRLAPAVGTAEPAVGDPQVEETTEALGDAAGVGAVADSIRSAASRVRGGALARPEPPAVGTVEAVRGRWLSTATAGLPDRWRRAVDRDVAPAGELRTAVAAAVEGVPLPQVRHRGTLALHIGGLVLAVLGVVGAVLGLLGTREVADLPGAPLLGAGAGLVAVGLAALVAARLWRGSRAERLATGYRETVHARVREVVRDDLAAPTTAVLDRHRALRVALAKGAAQRG